MGWDDVHEAVSVLTNLANAVSFLPMYVCHRSF
jgi:hypothetical protein